MNEQPIQQSFQDGPEPQHYKIKKSHKGRKVTGVILLILIALAGAGYSAFSWQQNQTLARESASKDGQIASLQADTSAAVEPTKDVAKVVTVTATLPNTKTITYPLSEQNAQIIWWASQPTGDQTAPSISDKRIFTFLHSIDANVLKTVCGSSDITGTDISLGLFDTKEKKYLNNQYADCLQLLGAESSPLDAITKTQAVQLRASALENVKAFISESTIQ